MLSGYKNSLEKYPEGPGKVVEFRMSNTVGTLSAIRAKLQSNHHHQLTNALTF